MDRDRIKRLQAQLSGTSDAASQRMVFQIAQARATSAPPDPMQFGSRTEYRQALIAYERARAAPGLQSLVKRLNELGLSTTVFTLSGTVVAEGRPAALRQALETEEFESADFDATIELIRPIKPKGGT